MTDYRSALFRKLDRVVPLDAADRTMLDLIATTNVRSVPARRDLVREGDTPRFAALVLDGWASRHKLLEDGRRQTVGFLLPGDVCDIDVFLLDEADHSVGAITALRVAQLPRELIDEVVARYPRIAQGLRWASLVDAAIGREWAVSLGQRSAIERIAHLLCELYLRLGAVDLVRDRTCEMPLTQTDVAEATGMTAVHVNRTIQELRARDLIRWRARELEMLDLKGLMRVGLFTSGYLHLRREAAAMPPAFADGAAALGQPLDS